MRGVLGATIIHSPNDGRSWSTSVKASPVSVDSKVQPFHDDNIWNAQDVGMWSKLVVKAHQYGNNQFRSR